MPTIDVSVAAEPAPPASVVFAPPSPPAPIGPLQFAIAPRVSTETDSTSPVAQLVSFARHPTPSAADDDRAVTSSSAAPVSPRTHSASAPTRETAEPSAETATPAVAFAVPRYEATVHERETLAACLVLEAASQGDFGMRAVMAVIRNRARGLPELFVPAVLRPKQFSALNRVTAGRESLASAIRRAKRERVWPTALAIVEDALRDTWHDPTGGATHYTRSAERTHWTRSLAKTTTIGAHSFYR